MNSLHLIITNTHNYFWQIKFYLNCKKMPLFKLYFFLSPNAYTKKTIRNIAQLQKIRKKTILTCTFDDRVLYCSYLFLKIYWTTIQPDYFYCTFLIKLRLMNVVLNFFTLLDQHSCKICTRNCNCVRVIYTQKQQHRLNAC